MNKIKKGDSVIVISGKDKGKKGEVVRLLDNNKCSVGDVIKIKQCRPISKTKTWVLVEDQG